MKGTWPLLNCRCELKQCDEVALHHLLNQGPYLDSRVAIGSHPAVLEGQELTGI